MQRFDVVQADVRDGLAGLADGSVQMVVTSPPYWGLRAYGTEPQDWGGDVECQHKWGASLPAKHDGQVPQTKWQNNESVADAGRSTSGSYCQLCGAWRGELGSEPTPAQFVANIVEVFRGVWRVLRDDGTIWVNLGSSYASCGRSERKESPGVGATQAMPKQHREVIWQAGGGSNFSWTLPGGFKPKDMVPIPWMVAMALQADGWYLRCDVIWAKKNPMPESVTDRPAKSHEYLFLLTKKPRYFYDNEAVREPNTAGAIERFGKNPKIATDNRKHASDPGAKTNRAAKADKFGEWIPGGRNLRSVWHLATHATKYCHYATFPPKLVEPCIKAGTSERGVCPACGAPWKRIVESLREHGLSSEAFPKTEAVGNDQFGQKRLHRRLKAARAAGEPHDNALGGSATTGWEPTCACNAGELPVVARRLLADPVPATVLDPFSGTATTGVVALELGRSYIGIELNPKDAAHSLKRLAGVMPLFSG